jgi:FkbM family methyltransferase
MSELPAHEEVATNVGAMLLPAHDSTILVTLKHQGFWEEGEAAALRALVRPGDNALVVGAHCGYMALLLGGAVGPRGSVVAVEPAPDNFALLRENIARNGLANVEAVNAAGWRSAGELEFAINPENTGDHRAYAFPGACATVRVETVKLDEVLPRRRPLHAVLVDAQGTDHVAIEGLRETLARWRPPLLVEFWPEGITAFGDDPAGVLRFYRSLGYELAVLDDPSRCEPSDADVLAFCAGKLSGYCTLVLRIRPRPRRRRRW